MRSTRPLLRAFAAFTTAGLCAAPAAHAATDPAPPAPLAEATVLVVAGPDDVALSRRLAAELGRLRFRSVEVTALPGPAARGPLEELARAHEAVAAIRVVPLAHAVEVWVTDRVTGKTVLREVLVPDSDPAKREALVALRAVELLRASLLEVGAAHPSRGEVGAAALPPDALPAPLATTAPSAPPPPAALPDPVDSAATVSAPAPSPTVAAAAARPAGARPDLFAPSRFTLQMGAGILLNIGTEGRFEYSPEPHVVLGARWQITRLAGLTLLAQIPTYPGIDRDRFYSVAVWSTLLGLAFRVGRAEGRVIPALDAGLFAAWVWVHGIVGPPFEGRTFDLAAAVVFARPSLSVALWGRVRLQAALWAGISAPYIQLGDNTDWGVPLLWCATVGLEVGLP